MTDPVGVVLDFDHRPLTLAEGQCLRAKGYRGVVIYINRASPQDVQDIFDAGLELHCIFQLGANYPGYFTPQQGDADARAIISHFARLHLPRLVCYIPVDTNKIAPADTVPYFNAADPVLFATTACDGGVYGYKPMVDLARATFGHLGKHLWQTYGPDPADTVELWQYEQVPAGDPRGCGFAIDLNRSYTLGWTPVPAPDPLWDRPDSTPLSLGDLKVYARRLQKELDDNYVRKP